jgi:hypothetical protein
MSKPTKNTTVLRFNYLSATLETKPDPERITMPWRNIFITMTTVTAKIAAHNTASRHNPFISGTGAAHSWRILIQKGIALHHNVTSAREFALRNCKNNVFQ